MLTVRINSPIEWKTKETLTVTSGAVVGLTASNYNDTTTTKGRGRPAIYALITAEGGDMRWWGGADPSTTVGHLLQAGMSVEIDGPINIAAFRIIATSATNGTLQVSYWRV